MKIQVILAIYRSYIGHTPRGGTPCIGQIYTKIYSFPLYRVKKYRKNKSLQRPDNNFIFPLFSPNLIIFNIFFVFILVLGRPGLAQPGLAWPGYAWPGLNRPGLAVWGDPHEKSLFYEKSVFISILAHSRPCRRQKWIRLEISVKMVVSGGLETWI